MSQETMNIPIGSPSKEPALTPELAKELGSHDQIRWVGPTGPISWTEKTWSKPNVKTVHLVNNKVYTLMCSPSDHTTTYYNVAGHGFYFQRMSVHVENLANWTLTKSRHDEVVLRTKQKRAWTMASKTFPRIRTAFSNATTVGRSRVKWDLRDLELSKKMELLSKLTPSELGLLEFLENDSKNPGEDVKRLFEVYHLYTSQQDNEKSV